MVLALDVIDPWMMEARQSRKATVGKGENVKNICIWEYVFEAQF